MSQAQQLEFYASTGNNLTGVGNDRVIASVGHLDQKYRISKHPDYYFIVCKSKYSNHEEDERICLYQDGVINKHLYGDLEPHALLLSNEERAGRRLETIYKAMEEKVNDFTTVITRKKQY